MSWQSDIKQHWGRDWREVGDLEEDIQIVVPANPENPALADPAWLQGCSFGSTDNCPISKAACGAPHVSRALTWATRVAVLLDDGRMARGIIEGVSVPAGWDEGRAPAPGIYTIRAPRGNRKKGSTHRATGKGIPVKKRGRRSTASVLRGGHH